MFPIKFGIWVDEIRVFRMKCWCLSVFANKWLCEVLENDFWDGWNLNFSVDYDRAMCQERVGENDIKVRLTVWILCAKWWKRKNEEKVVLSDEHGRVYILPFLARPCVCMAWAVHVVRTSVSRFLCFFTHLCFELAFGVNMKVLDNCVSFPMTLVSLENVLWILSYDENTPSRCWRNFKET